MDFPKDHVYLIQGDPGAGKTTLSLQFLLEGAKRGEKALYITLSETRRELHAVAKFARLVARTASRFTSTSSREETLSEEEDTTIFHPSEIELGQTVSRILDEVERVNPQRVVLDSLSEIRLLSQSNLRYRKQILALKQYFTNRGTTSLFLDDRTSEGNDLQLHSVPHGVHRAGAARAVVWRAAAPAGDHQAARRRLPRRLSRLHHPTRRHRALPAARRGEGSRRRCRGPSRQRHRGDRRAARRRARARIEHADHGTGRRRQIDAGDAIRGRGGETRREVPRCSSSTRAGAACSNVPRRSAWTWPDR